MKDVTQSETWQVWTKRAIEKVTALRDCLMELDEYWSSDAIKRIPDGDLEQKVVKIINDAVEGRRKVEELFVSAVDAVWQVVVGCPSPHDVTIECRCGRWRCSPPIWTDVEAKDE